ncbi:hypothetical protein M2451_002627 [Dysgonomonas sp. PFB1-18]|uniref:hypothetical protein n=1 Tax=unclassified Dysgonomonas TaxID=2630389 RepID=UPI00247621A6|nr:MULTISPECIES: hypothetical protein [unclassified Dysgonomonas]MDH6308108.1 hypothetical protein [Dysgonomonas sp. PF1-14]MDH6339647.1 hypothetical protein [Dysgonomonas sp. PF1-16]MDH6381298.1 hypothetical protein [Dysgonomonas sp. PFB1-18]MDH6398510.1 hypothetical protein [Dysgonomonas sp. PF1-23]
MSKDSINKLTEAFNELNSSMARLLETSSNFENTIIMFLRVLLAKEYANFQLYKARKISSGNLLRVYWRWRAKRQGKIVRSIIESLPEGIKYEVTTELLEVINGNR